MFKNGDKINYKGEDFIFGEVAGKWAMLEADGEIEDTDSELSMQINQLEIVRSGKEFFDSLTDHLGNSPPMKEYALSWWLHETYAEKSVNGGVYIVYCDASPFFLTDTAFQEFQSLIRGEESEFLDE